MRATLYTSNDCAFSAELRDRLERDGASFQEINVSECREALPELLKLTGGKRVVPVLVDDGGVHVAPFGGTTF